MPTHPSSLMSFRRDTSDSDESGFTLVEILVVVLIIGILAAIAIPMFTSQRREAFDASLKSDLRNAGTAYYSWVQTNSISNTEFRDIAANGIHGVYVLGPETTLDMGTGGNENKGNGKGNSGGGGSSRPLWSDSPELPTLHISEGTVLEFQVRDEPHPASWHRGHRSGEFCIRGYNVSSNHTYSGDSVNNMGVGNGGYSGNLFYDSNMGGLVSAEEIAEDLQNGGEPSCYWYGETWMDNNA